MHSVLREDEADDFVVGTGEAHSVREFVEEAFSYVGLEWQKHVQIDPRYFRPLDPEELIADTSKAKKVLGWSPRIRFKELVRIMVDADMRKAGLKPIGEGDEIIKRSFPDRWWKVD